MNTKTGLSSTDDMTENLPMQKPRIFDFTDICFYLKAVYVHRKIKERDFSYESWAAELGLSSRSYLRLVVIGKRPLADRLISSFCKNLDLNAEEAGYFALLTKYSLCKTAPAKESIGRQLLAARQVRFDVVEVRNPKEFLMDPMAPVIFTVLAEKELSRDCTSLADIFDLDKERIQNILNSLIRLNLVVEKLNSDGVISYEASSPTFRIPSDPSNQFIAQFHDEGMEQAKKAHALPFEKRRFRSLFFHLSKEDMENAQDLINEFAAKVLGQFSEKSKDEFEVYRLNLQLFPVTKTINKR